MYAIESPKKSNNIATASTNAVSNILLSPHNPTRPALKSKVSKTETNLNKGILQCWIYVDADTTFYKDFSIHYFSLKMEEEKASITPFFSEQFFGPLTL